MEIPLTIADHLRRAEVVYGDRIAIVDEPDQVAAPLPDLTYARTADLSRAMAAGLDAMGLDMGARVAMASHAVTIGCLFGLWWVAELGPVFFCGVAAVSGLLAWEHWLVRPDDLSRVGLAFFQINALISLGLFAVGLVDVLLFPVPVA